MHHVENFWQCITPFNEMNITASAFGYFEAEKPDEWHFKNFSAPFNKLYFIKEGEIFVDRMYPNGKLDYTYCLTAGNVYLIPCNNLYNLYIKGSMKKYFIHFNFILKDSEDLFSEMPKIYNAPFPYGRIESLKNSLEKNELWTIFRAKSIVYESLIQIADHTEMNIFAERTKLISQYSHIILNTIKYINNNTRANLTLNEIAENLHITSGIISAEFKEHLNMTVKQYICKKITEKARLLLLTTDMSVKSIAAVLKFGDPYIFSKFFKKHTYFSPTEFKMMSVIAHH